MAHKKITNIPRNSYVVAMNKRFSRTMKFHHRCALRGGARNEHREFLSELDEYDLDEDKK